MKLNIKTLINECIIEVLKEGLQPSDSPVNSSSSKPVNSKTVAILQKWIAKDGSRDAAKKLIDYILHRRLGLNSDHLPDTSTFASGLDGVSDALDQQDWRGAIDIAKDTATEMIEDEGGAGMNESADSFDKFRKELGAEKVNEFLTKFGLGPNYKPSKSKTYPCPKCKKNNATYHEEGADCDGGQNEMVLECPDCGYCQS